MKKITKRAEVEIGLCRSAETKKLYYVLTENGTPLKYWAYDDMSDAARDFIGELVNAFDLGYDIRCQFPIEKDGEKLLKAKEVRMYNEPGTKQHKTNAVENFFVSDKAEEDAEG